MDPITTMTPDELATVQRELNELETAGRAGIAARIKTARGWGDLKENGEYHAAKEAQAHLETRIARLRDQVRGAELVVEAPTADVVSHGSTVDCTNRATGRKQRFRIVSAHDAKPSEGLLSAASPVARSLLGHRAGDVVEVSTPGGVRALSIDAIS
jgi:transcription elongation factor GreA